MHRKRAITLKDGTPGIVRPIGPADSDALAAGLEELSEESRVRRYFFNKRKISDPEMATLANPDGVDHLAYGLAVTLEEEKEKETPIAVARCFRDTQKNDLAEVAVVVADLWQGIGAGTELMRSLSAAALKVGIRRWSAVTFSDNSPVRRLLERFGKIREERDLGGGVTELVADIKEPPGR